MIPVDCVTARRIAAALLLLAAAGCDAGPKTYDDCMLQASRSADKDRQFRAMAERCKVQFQGSLPFRAPPADAKKPEALRTK